MKSENYDGEGPRTMFVVSKRKGKSGEQAGEADAKGGGGKNGGEGRRLL